MLATRQLVPIQITIVNAKLVLVALVGRAAALFTCAAVLLYVRRVNLAVKSAIITVQLPQQLGLLLEAGRRRRKRTTLII